MFRLFTRQWVTNTILCRLTISEWASMQIMVCCILGCSNPAQLGKNTDTHVSRVLHSEWLLAEIPVYKKQHPVTHWLRLAILCVKIFIGKHCLVQCWYSGGHDQIQYGGGPSQCDSTKRQNYGCIALAVSPFFRIFLQQLKWLFMSIYQYIE